MARKKTCYWCGKRGHSGDCYIYRKLMEQFTKEEIARLYALKDRCGLYMLG